MHVTKEFYEAIVNLLDTSKEDSNRIFTKILKKLSPIENWKTTLDEYEAQDQIKATIGKNILFFYRTWTTDKIYFCILKGL